MAGVDIPIEEVKLVAHIPTIKEIAYMGETEFFSAIQYLCIEKEQVIQDKNILSQVTDFQVLMKVLEGSDNKEKRKIVLNLLRIMFPQYLPVMTKNSIIFTIVDSDSESILIDENNFQVFQNAIKEILCVNSLFQRDNIVYNPLNAKAKEIADKLMAGRRKVAEIKAKEGQSNESTLVRYISILVVGTNTMNLEDCVNLNMFQLFDLIERYNAFVEWDVDVRVRLAGGKPEKKVESWMRDLHSDKTDTAFTEDDTSSSGIVQF